jgi:hypothetical protein
MLRAPFSPHRSAGLKAAGKPPKVGIVAVMRHHQGALDAAG